MGRSSHLCLCRVCAVLAPLRRDGVKTYIPMLIDKRNYFASLTDTQTCANTTPFGSVSSKKNGAPSFTQCSIERVPTPRLFDKAVHFARRGRHQLRPSRPGGCLTPPRRNAQFIVRVTPSFFYPRSLKWLATLILVAHTTHAHTYSIDPAAQGLCLAVSSCLGATLAKYERWPGLASPPNYSSSAP